jgi:putative ABC transport system permease protein
MTEEDARMMAQRFRDTIVRVAPTARGNVTVKVGNRSWYCQCVAVTPEYAFVNKHPAMQGRFISDDDVRGRTKVCVIGATTVENVFGSEDIDVIGKNVLLNRIQFKIVGVLKRKGIGGFGRDEDDTVLVPLSTGMRRLFNVTYLSGINIQCSDESKMDVAMEQVSNFYRDRHKLTPPFPRNDDFHVHNQGAMLQLTSGASLQLTGMLTGIALVSLVVGGVGIMNIMLVTVNERTREIGLRKAVGATGMQILLQFLVEAIVVSFMGGVLGIAFGLGVAKILNTYLDMRTLITMQSIIISVAVSCAIGLFFGIYPAAKAAQLHPIDALRYE